jgi:hypothetical protein
MNEVLHNLEMRRRADADMTLKLLALVFSKPLEQYNKFPDWNNCNHVTLEITTQWPNAERELMPMLNCLAGNLVSKCRTPEDICIVRKSGTFSVCVKY